MRVASSKGQMCSNIRRHRRFFTSCFSAELDVTCTHCGLERRPGLNWTQRALENITNEFSQTSEVNTTQPDISQTRICLFHWSENQHQRSKIPLSASCTVSRTLKGLYFAIMGQTNNSWTTSQAFFFALFRSTRANMSFKAAPDFKTRAAAASSQLGLDSPTITRPFNRAPGVLMYSHYPRLAHTGRHTSGSTAQHLRRTAKAAERRCYFPHKTAKL